MLADYPAYSTIAVTDLERAKAFYENQLGLTPLPGPPGGLMYGAAGETRVFLYEREAPTKGDHTLVTWIVTDIEALMAEMKARGVKFEDYDLPGIKTVDGLASDGTMHAAWFRDPDGNVLGLAEAPH